ncbi:hypothetical protein ZHAS_00007998 [Anopheles sinensis]|uniref:Uncharacterized protein n=1 Tax=Anopheles sinensis TaxID=74873 RepID=A0A084VRB2_ANOSI|nr:hypothetical protein ZHAS_00007998 [Anopheles sinensis]
MCPLVCSMLIYVSLYHDTTAKASHLGAGGGAGKAYTGATSPICSRMLLGVGRGGQTRASIDDRFYMRPRLVRHTGRRTQQGPRNRSDARTAQDPPTKTLGYAVRVCVQLDKFQVRRNVRKVCCRAVAGASPGGGLEGEGGGGVGGEESEVNMTMHPSTEEAMEAAIRL